MFIWGQTVTNPNCYKRHTELKQVQLNSFVHFHLVVIRPGVLVRSNVTRVFHQLLTAFPPSAFPAFVEALLVGSGVPRCVSEAAHCCRLLHFLKCKKGTTAMTPHYPQQVTTKLCEGGSSSDRLAQLGSDQGAFQCAFLARLHLFIFLCGIKHLVVWPRYLLTSCFPRLLYLRSKQMVAVDFFFFLNW